MMVKFNAIEFVAIFFSTRLNQFRDSDDLSTITVDKLVKNDKVNALLYSTTKGARGCSCNNDKLIRNISFVRI